ncbi:MAG: carbohydrate kinase family protein [Proteobacteria bacterium]|nr:MAG: carbohydrate kinase family protein [Pseudomonadota bacterium]
MSALICGSIAYDTIMVFQDQFKNHIIPDKVHILNVSFLVPEMRREFGGCAGNIAYNLQLLGERALPMATVGRDFGPYAEWMNQCGIATDHIKVIEGAYTAQAYITTDLDANQITAFHPGAMQESHANQVAVGGDVTIGMVSPDGRQGMLDHAEQFAASGIPFIFDPGQGMPLFSGEELLRFVDLASWVAVNDYECELLQERTNHSLKDLANRVEAMIVTRGGEGSQINAAGRQIDIPPVMSAAAVDPTGCGDAYRAGLLFGLMNQLDWEATGRIASLLGTIKVEHHGTQNHHFTRDEFFDRFEKAYGFRPA